MIQPPRRGQPYPGRLPPVPQQWARLSLGFRWVLVASPIALVAIVFDLSLAAGTTAAVLIVGVAGATVMFAKNRTDRHNAAVDRGEIAVVPDPHIRAVAAHDLSDEAKDRLAAVGFDLADPVRVQRFDGGWLVRRRNPRDVAAVVGDDGGCAQFDPRSVTDLWAVAEYLAGRGRDNI